MQKIIIKNFGPIKEVELEIQDFMVFIGPQASGKSTIAKLVYFFKSLQDDIIFHWSEQFEKDNLISMISNPEERFLTIGSISDLYRRITHKFRDIFGNPRYMKKEMLLSYYFTDSLHISVKLNENKAILINLSNDFHELLTRTFTQSSYIGETYHVETNEKTGETKQTLIMSKKQSQYSVFLSTLMNGLADIKPINFIPTSRALLNQYGYFLLQLQTLSGVQELPKLNSLDINYLNLLKNAKDLLKDQSISEFLSQEEVYFHTQENYKHIDFLKLLQTLKKKIIKGEYEIDKDGTERIRLTDDVVIGIEHSSSGQQEAISILLYLIYLAMMKDYSAYSIIEEPEVHLYPISQKYMMDALSLILNFSKRNQILITTHSPYILTSLNNLLTAYKTAQMSEAAKEEVKQMLPEEVWLNPEKLAVYFVAEGVIKSVVNDKTGLIGEQELDEVSDLIGDEFDNLMEIRRKYWNLTPQV